MSESEERPDYYESDRGEDDDDEEEVVEEVVEDDVEDVVEDDVEDDVEDEEGSPHLVAGVNQYTHMGFTDCLYEDPLAGLAVGMDARTRVKNFGALTPEQTFRKTAKQYIDSKVLDNIELYYND